MSPPRPIQNAQFKLFPSIREVAWRERALNQMHTAQPCKTDTRDAGLFLYAALGHSPHDAVKTAMDERVRHLGDILEGDLRLV